MTAESIERDLRAAAAQPSAGTRRTPPTAAGSTADAAACAAARAAECTVEPSRPPAHGAPGQPGSEAESAGVAGGIIADLVKSVVIVRIFFLYPVVITWVNAGLSIIELIVTLLLSVESLIVLLRWSRVAAFIQRHPLTLSIDILLAVTVLAVIGGDSPFFLYLCATAVLIGLIYTATSRTLLTALVFLAYGAAALTRAVVAPVHEGTAVLASLISAAGGFALIGVLVHLGSSLRRMQQRVDTAISVTRRNASEAALGEERSRIAQELHDSTVKSLVGIDLLARAIDRAPQTAEPNAELISQAAASAIGDSRRILADLRVTSLPPLESSLRALAAEYESLYSVRFRLQLSCTEQLPLPVRYTARKIAEEAMSNAARHSGAEEVTVSLERAGEAIVLTITDQGVGIGQHGRTERRGHYGLTGMRERAGNLGCALRIDSPPGGGTRVLLRIPCTVMFESDAP